MAQIAQAQALPIWPSLFGAESASQATTRVRVGTGRWRILFRFGTLFATIQWYQADCRGRAARRGYFRVTVPFPKGLLVRVIGLGSDGFLILRRRRGVPMMRKTGFTVSSLVAL